MQDLIASLLHVVSPQPLAYSLVGVVAGVIVGAIPGLGGGMLMALLLPLTFAMDNVLAQILLIGVYVGGITGGLVSAILIGVPGSPAAVMTALDGGAMARQAAPRGRWPSASPPRWWAGWSPGCCWPPCRGPWPTPPRNCKASTISCSSSWVWF